MSRKKPWENRAEAEINGHLYAVVLKDNNNVDIFRDGIFFTDAVWDPKFLVLLDIKEDFSDDYIINSEVSMALDDLIVNELIDENDINDY